MNSDEQRQTPPPRLPEAQQPNPSPTSGEPKRLSQ
jgi:hypothetical protein